MKHVFILNIYGNYDYIEKYKSIVEVCEKRGINYVVETNSRMTTEEILDKYSDGGNIIYAVGGDGMINKVVNGVVGTNNYFSYIPVGTGNDFNRSVEELYKKDGLYPIDTLKINEKYFINIACFGIDAKIANDDRFIHNNYIPSNMRYLSSILANFLTYKPDEVEISMDGKKIKNKFTTVVAANGRYYGGGYNISPTSKLDDEKIELYLVDNVDKIRMAKLISSMKNGKHLDSPYIQASSCSELNLRYNKKVKANVDGEVLESNEFKISIIKNKVKLYNYKELRKVLSK